MITASEINILKELLPFDSFVLFTDTMKVIESLNYREHYEEIDDIFSNIDNEKNDLKARLNNLLSIHLNTVSSRIGVVFDNGALLSTRVAIIKAITTLDDIEFALREKLLEDMSQIDSDNIDKLIIVIEEFSFVNHDDIYYDISEVKLTLIKAIEEMLGRKDIEVDNAFLTDMIVRSKLKEIVSKLKFEDGVYNIGVFVKDIDIDTSITTLTSRFGKDLKTNNINDYLNIVIYMLVYSKEGRKDPLTTFLDYISDMTSLEMKQKTSDAISSIIERLKNEIKERRIDV